MCTANLLYPIIVMGFLGAISALLITGSILGFQKSKRNKEKSPSELKG